MKKILFCALSALFILGSVVSCGKDSPKNQKDEKPTPTPTPTPTPDKVEYDKELILSGRYYFPKKEVWANSEDLAKEMKAAYTGPELSKIWDYKTEDDFLAYMTLKESETNKIVLGIMAYLNNSGKPVAQLVHGSIPADGSMMPIPTDKDDRSGGENNFFTFGEKFLKTLGITQTQTDMLSEGKMPAVIGLNQKLGLLMGFLMQDLSSDPSKKMLVTIVLPNSSSSAAVQIAKSARNNPLAK